MLLVRNKKKNLKCVLHVQCMDYIDKVKSKKEIWILQSNFNLCLVEEVKHIITRPIISI